MRAPDATVQKMKSDMVHQQQLPNTPVAPAVTEQQPNKPPQKRHNNFAPRLLLCYGKESRLRGEEAAMLQEQKCEQCLKRASLFAAEGNLETMHAMMDQAQEHAKRAGIYNESFRLRVADIQNSLSEERTRLYHENQIHHCLDRAELYATEGNKDMVLYQIQKAKSHVAQKKRNNNNTQSSRNVVEEKEQLILDILRSTEVTFHQRKSEHCLQRAARYADEGKREMTQFFLKDAMKHAKKGRCYDKEFKNRMATVQNTLKHKTAKQKVPNNSSTCMRSLGSSQSTLSSSTTTTPRSVDEVPLLDNDGEEEIEVEFLELAPWQ